MKNKWLSLSFIVFVLSSLLWYANCARVGLTVVGNPKPKQTAQVQAVIDDACDAITRCSNFQRENCENKVLSLVGLPAALGTPQFATLMDVDSKGSDIFISKEASQKCFGDTKSSICEGLKNQNLENLNSSLIENQSCGEVFKSSSLLIQIKTLTKTNLEKMATAQTDEGLVVAYTEKGSSGFPVYIENLTKQQVKTINYQPAFDIYGSSLEPKGFLILTKAAADSIYSWYNIKLGELAPGPKYARENSYVLSDFNGDNFADLIIYNEASQEIQFFEGNSNCPFCKTQTPRFSYKLTRPSKEIFICSSKTEKLVCAEQDLSFEKYRIDGSGFSMASRVTFLKWAKVVALPNFFLGIGLNKQLSYFTENESNSLSLPPIDSTVIASKGLVSSIVVAFAGGKKSAIISDSLTYVKQTGLDFAENISAASTHLENSQPSFAFKAQDSNRLYILSPKDL